MANLWVLEAALIVRDRFKSFLGHSLLSNDLLCRPYSDQLRQSSSERKLLVMRFIIFLGLLGPTLNGSLALSQSLRTRSLAPGSRASGGADYGIHTDPLTKRDATSSCAFSKRSSALRKRMRDGLERERTQSEILQELTEHREAGLRYERFIDKSPKTVEAQTKARDEWIKAEIRRKHLCYLRGAYYYVRRCEGRRLVLTHHRNFLQEGSAAVE